MTKKTMDRRFRFRISFSFLSPSVQSCDLFPVNTYIKKKNKQTTGKEENKNKKTLGFAWEAILKFGFSFIRER